MGKTKPVQLNDLLSEKSGAPPTNAYEEMCKESEKLCSDKIPETVKDKSKFRILFIIINEHYLIFTIR